mgnify:CR=1 FL=1
MFVNVDLDVGVSPRFRFRTTSYRQQKSQFCLRCLVCDQAGDTLADLKSPKFTVYAKKPVGGLAKRWP